MKENINDIEFSYRNREFLVVVLDHSFKVQRVSFIEDIGSCYPPNTPISKQEFTQIADGFFTSVGTYGRRTYKDTSGVHLDIAFHQIIYFQDFVLFHQSPCDFGLAAIYDRCRGRLIYASNINWWGSAKQIYPFNFYASKDILSSKNAANKPDSIFILTNEGGYNVDTFEGFNSLLDISVISKFALQPYNILVYHLLSGEGMLDVDFSEWIIILFRSYPNYNK